MSQWYKWQLHLHYHHVWWVVLHLKRVIRILFHPKKHFKIESCSKLHIHLKRELSHEIRQPEIIPTKKHILCNIVSSQYRWVQLQTLAKMISLPGLSSNTVKCSTPSSVDRFHTDLCGDRSMKVATTAPCHRSGYWSTTPRTIIHIPLNKHTFSHTERVALHRHGFPNCCWNGVITWFIVWPLLSSCIQTLATKLSSMHYLFKIVIPIFTKHTNNNEKMWPSVARCSFVTCALPHRVVKSCDVMPCHKIQT